MSRLTARCLCRGEGGIVGIAILARHHEIETEQQRAGINDPTHFAYPTYAKAAIQRRENLTRSADELRIQLEDAKSSLGEAFEELKKVELLDERDQARERAEENAREQADLNSIGLMRARIGAVA